jgi:hypothetical protein
VALEEQEWRELKKTGKQLIPTVTFGYDDRWNGGGIHTGDATPSEIANHLRNALAFIAANPASDQANLLVLSAWNEYVEDHFLSPFNSTTNSIGSGRLDAIGAVLNAQSGQPRISPGSLGVRTPRSSGTDTASRQRR